MSEYLSRLADHPVAIAVIAAVVLAVVVVVWKGRP